VAALGGMLGESVLCVGASWRIGFIAGAAVLRIDLIEKHEMNADDKSFKVMFLTARLEIQGSMSPKT
jgi:hypothetical protein